MITNQKVILSLLKVKKQIQAPRMHLHGKIHTLQLTKYCLLLITNFYNIKCYFPYCNHKQNLQKHVLLCLLTQLYIIEKKLS